MVVVTGQRCAFHSPMEVRDQLLLCENRFDFVFFHWPPSLYLCSGARQIYCMTKGNFGDRVTPSPGCMLPQVVVVVMANALQSAYNLG
jgi:hypothetical protein